MKKIYALMFMVLMVFTLSSVDLHAQTVGTFETTDITLPTSYDAKTTINTSSYNFHTYTTYNSGTNELEIYYHAESGTRASDLSLYITDTNKNIIVEQLFVGTSDQVNKGKVIVSNADTLGSGDFHAYIFDQAPSVFEPDLITDETFNVLLDSPTLTYNNITTGSDTLSFDYTINDPDGVITTDGIQYTFGGTTETLTALSGTITETELEPDTEYTPEIALSYDTGDGSGVQTDTYTETATTKNSIIAGIFGTVSAVVLGGIGVMSALFVESGITRVFWAPGDPGNLTLFAWILLLPVGLFLVRWGFMKVLNLIRMRR